MAKSTPTPTGYSGEFETPGTSFPGAAAGSGTFTLKGAADAQWLQVNYLSGEKPLTLQVDGTNGETILLYPGTCPAAIAFNVSKPGDGVTLSYQGKAKLTWEWDNKGTGGEAGG